MNGEVLKLLLVEDNLVAVQLVKAMLLRADTAFLRADTAVFEIQTAETLMGALDLLGAAKFDVILLDLSLPDSEGIETLTTIRVHAPQVPVLVLTGSDDESLANSALRHGAQDYIVKGKIPGESLVRALRYAVTRNRQTNMDEVNTPRATIAGILGAKGGVGASTVAVHLALETRRLTGQEVLLVDLDVTGGTIGFLTKVEHPYTILDASLNLHRLDTALLQSFVWKHSSGVDVLQSPGSTRLGDQLRDERVRHLLRLAQTRYAWIVIDMGRFNEVSINLIGEVNRLVLVANADVPALFETRRVVQKLGELGYPSGQIRLIMNRASRGDLDIPGLEKTFGIPIGSFLPDVRRELHEAYSEGKLLLPGSSFRRQIARMAMDLTGAGSESESGKPSGMRFPGLRRLLHGRNEASC